MPLDSRANIRTENSRKDRLAQRNLDNLSSNVISECSNHNRCDVNSCSTHLDAGEYDGREDAEEGGVPGLELVNNPAEEGSGGYSCHSYQTEETDNKAREEG